jgi:Protein of unknown function (DUF2948)
MTERLRLKAVDNDDLSVIAACLQDALVPLSEMAYLADQKRFVAAFTRFRRECLADPDGCAGLTQCQSALAFDQVEAALHCGLDSRFGAVKLELLTLVAEPPGEDGLTDVTLLFSGDAAIRLRVHAIAVTLEDFGEPWPAPVPPAHDLPAGPPERP